MAVLIAPLMAQQMVPDGPIVNFQVPYFGETGQREWELSGMEGRYHSPQKLEVTGLLLVVYDPAQPDQIRTRIEANTATIHPEARRADGQSFLYITETDGSFSVAGRNWTWFGNDSRIIIRENARVTFREAIGSLLYLD